MRMTPTKQKYFILHFPENQSSESNSVKQTRKWNKPNDDDGDDGDDVQDDDEAAAAACMKSKSKRRMQEERNQNLNNYIILHGSNYDDSIKQ